MADLWAWLAVAGLGAVHALNPATGWALAAAWAARSRNSSLALSALLPIAAGHMTAIALAAAAAMFGYQIERGLLQWVVVGLLAGSGVLLFLPSHAIKRVRAPMTPVALALWTLVTSTTHGAGLMLLPVLIPLCRGDGVARQITADGSLTLALAAVAIHTAVMLAVTGMIAVSAHRVFSAAPGILRCLARKRETT